MTCNDETILGRIRNRRLARRAAGAQRGMTLLEIMIVFAIIALVMGFLVGPRVMGAFGDAKIKTAGAVIKQLTYEAYPRWSADNVGKSCPQSLDEMLKYMNKQDIKDPWGNDYVMYCGDNVPQGAKGGFAVISYGPDGRQGTDDDIKSWEDL